MVVISDLRGPRDWAEPILQLAGRHDVVAVEMRDPREERLPDVGDIWVVDPETGRSCGSTPAASASASASRRPPRPSAPRSPRSCPRAGVGHVVLSTEGEWLRPLVTFLRNRGGRR